MVSVSVCFFKLCNSSIMVKLKVLYQNTISLIDLHSLQIFGPILRSMSNCEENKNDSSHLRGKFKVFINHLERIAIKWITTKAKITTQS